MKFNLVHTELTKLNFEKILSDNDASDDTGYNVSVKLFIDTNNNKMFGVLFHLTFRHERDFSLDIGYLAWFESDKELQQKDIESELAQINAPAIAFPYVRGFVSLLTLNAGVRPVILPTINFVKMYQDHKAAQVKKT